MGASGSCLCHERKKKGREGKERGGEGKGMKGEEGREGKCLIFLQNCGDK
jgi:hypothetical protein